MSLADMKEQLQTLSYEERLSLEEYLRILNRIDDPQVRRGVDEAMARMDAGESVSGTEFERRIIEQESKAS